LIPPDDDGIVVGMSETEPRTVTRAEFNRELVQALDDLVADARYHDEQIRASFARSDELSRRLRAEEAARAEDVDVSPLLRETPPPYGGVPERLDRIERTLTDIRDQMATKIELEAVRRMMATKIELEAVNDRIKMVADGYQTVGKRLDQVADLLKLRVVMP